MLTTKVNKSLIILLLTFIFVGPMVAAWLTYSHGLFLSGGKVNHGLLMQPTVPISTLALVSNQEPANKAQLKGKWWLIYLTADPENSLAQRNLYYIRQIRQATGKNRDRIERAIITLQTKKGFDDWLRQHYPGTLHFTISHEKIAEIEASLPKKLALEKGSLYLVDPLGNILLFYAPDAAPKGILKDLERVLKVSQIG
ncbi:MAG: hypothetical protein H0U71_01305 [Gammaproteobacteria bacterium]|nr:hypothetical protein [Gammaproteobacteria bacterium]